MTASLLRSTALGVGILAVLAVTASAETISRETARRPIAVGAATTTSPLSRMPYACDGAELRTRIQRRTCR